RTYPLTAGRPRALTVDLAALTRIGASTEMGHGSALIRPGTWRPKLLASGQPTGGVMKQTSAAGVAVDVTDRTALDIVAQPTHPPAPAVRDLRGLWRRALALLVPVPML